MAQIPPYFDAKSLLGMEKLKPGGVTYLGEPLRGPMGMIGPAGASGAAGVSMYGGGGGGGSSPDPLRMASQMMLVPDTELSVDFDHRKLEYRFRYVRRYMGQTINVMMIETPENVQRYHEDLRAIVMERLEDGVRQVREKMLVSPERARELQRSQKKDFASEVWEKMKNAPSKLREMIGIDGGRYDAELSALAGLTSASDKVAKVPDPAPMKRYPVNLDAYKVKSEEVTMDKYKVDTGKYEVEL